MLQKILKTVRNDKQNETAAYRTGKDICERCIRLWVNIQNMQRTHTTHIKNPIKKWAEDRIAIFPKKTYRWSTGT